MLKYFLKRLIFSVIALFVLMTVIFLLMSVIPTEPLKRAQGELVDAYNQRLYNAHLGSYPLWSRYCEYWTNLFHGNLGAYYSTEGSTIQEELFPRIPNTLYIAFIAYILSTLIGFLFGFIAAIYRGKWQDTLVNVLSVVFISVPSFIVGTLLLKLAGAIQLPQRFSNFGGVGWDGGTFVLSSMLPIFSLVFGLASSLTYYVRNEVVEIINQDYIKTAQSKGAGTWTLIWRHMLRNSCIPALSILGPSLLSTITGSIVLEQMFGVSGIANILVTAVENNEVNVVMFQTLFLSGIYFLLAILLDLLYTAIDPRIRLAASSGFSFVASVKFARIRALWLRRWRGAATKLQATVAPNSSLERLIIEHKLLNERKRTVTVHEWFYDRYGIDRGAQCFIIRNRVYAPVPAGQED